MHSHTGGPPVSPGRLWLRLALRLPTIILIVVFSLQFIHSLAQALDYSGEQETLPLNGAVSVPDPGLVTQPPDTSLAWTAEGDRAFALFGYAVASAGDVNGDGYDDLIVGAPYYGQSRQGAVFVFHGSATGPGTTPDWTAEGDRAFALFGYAVASAGDVNGDGYDDVIVGAPSYDNGRISQGAAFLYQGAASGLETDPSWTTEGGKSLALFGHDVGSAGDVNGDGYDDVIVGAPGYYDRFDWFEGWTFVYHGSATGLSATATWMAEGNQRGAEFGSAVNTAGDVNGDGYADIIVGAPGYNHGQQNEGRALVYHGSAAGLDATATWTAESDRRSAHLGDAVGTAGDVNGDGYDEVIVGAPGYDKNPGRRRKNEGAAFLYHGSAIGLSPTADWIREGDQARARFASAVAGAGDVNSDGYGDVLIGAPYHDDDGTNEGASFLYHGTAAGLREAADWATESDQSWALFGNAVNTAGDVNGDANADIVVGAPLYDQGQRDEGRSYLFYGTGATAPVAGFSASPLTGTAPLTVAFNNHSTGATGYLWHFGDDVTATLPTPVHVYQQSGAYTVTLTATGAGGSDTLTRANYITVVSPIRTWRPLSAATTPPVNGEYAMAYDRDRDVVVLYGGNASGWPYENTTWEFDGTDWSAIPTAQQPQAVYGMAMAYDDRRGRVVLFGGSSAADVPLAQTWEYDGSDWIQRTPTASPPARANSALVHDANSGQLLLFGGQDGHTYYDDTWVYDGSSWSQIATVTSPPARVRHAMAPDAGEGTILLFGGRSASGILYADLWSFDPDMANWTDISSTGPAARQAHSFVHDGHAGDFVLVGGTDDATDTLLNDTWHYQADRGWVEATPPTAVPAGAYHTAVYDGKAILLLVDGETWQYR